MIELPPDLLAAAPSTLIRLRMKAENLRDRDFLTKSDPCCVVFKQNNDSTHKVEWIEIGRTEMIRNELSPEWLKTITVEYFFEERQHMKFEVYDIDRNTAELDKQDFLGYLECDLAEIVSEETIVKPLCGFKKNCGILHVSSEEVDQGAREVITFEARAEKVEKKDFFGLGKSDPYLSVYRINPDCSKSLVHRTEFVQTSRSPKWLPFQVNLMWLCRGDRSGHVIFECWDNDEKTMSTADYIGSATVAVEDILDNEYEFSVELINEKKKRKKGNAYKNSGVLFIRATKHVQHTFLDYITTGTQLDFTVAVDFTTSNGLVYSPDSLHYIGYDTPNQYETAIRSVLEICQHYNSRKIFDAYGFGAAIPPSRLMIPLFDLSNPQHKLENPEVEGVAGVLSAYRHSLNNVNLFGPTKFAPIIDEVAKRIAGRRAEKGSRYEILLIITDGVICDLTATKKSIIECCHLPISIIIIGVGNANFDAMNELDGDSIPLNLQGRIASRDIVQFVPLRNFMETKTNHLQVMAKLAKEVLAEVPDQFMTYMRMNKIDPRPTSKPTTLATAEFSRYVQRNQNQAPSYSGDQGEGHFEAYTDDEDETNNLPEYNGTDDENYEQGAVPATSTSQVGEQPARRNPSAPPVSLFSSAALQPSCSNFVRDPAAAQYRISPSMMPVPQADNILPTITPMPPVPALPPISHHHSLHHQPPPAYHNLPNITSHSTYMQATYGIHCYDAHASTVVAPPPPYEDHHQDSPLHPEPASRYNISPRHSRV